MAGAGGGSSPCSSHWAGIAALAFCQPPQASRPSGSLALFVAFASATQDIVIDAYRTDILTDEERGAGAAVSVTAWRIGALVSGGAGLILADHLGFRSTYLVMAGLMLIGIAATLLAPEPDGQATAPKSMGEAVRGPFKDFFARSGAVKMLAAVVLYKLGDAYAETLSTLFLLNLHFSLTEVGEINKVLGTVATIGGAAIAGASWCASAFSARSSPSAPCRSSRYSHSWSWRSSARATP